MSKNVFNNVIESPNLKSDNETRLKNIESLTDVSGILSRLSSLESRMSSAESEINRVDNKVQFIRTTNIIESTSRLNLSTPNSLIILTEDVSNNQRTTLLVTGNKKYNTIGLACLNLGNDYALFWPKSYNSSTDTITDKYLVK